MSQATMRLADLCDVVTDRVEPEEQPDAVYVGLKHLETGRFARKGEGKAAETKSSKSAFRAGDILYGKLGAYLDKAVLVEDEGICSTDILVVRSRQDVDSRFLLGVIHSPQFIEHAVAGTTGVSHPRTSWSHISEFQFPSYAQEEQKNIGDFLWLMHKALTASEAVIEAGERLKQSALNEIFRKGLVEEKLQKTEFGEIPKSWELQPIDSVGTVVGGKRIPKGATLISENTGKPYIRVTDFSCNSVTTDQVLFVPNEYQSMLQRYTISSNDIYVSIAGTVGLVGQIPQILDEANLTENAAKVTLTKEDILTRYVMYALDSEVCQKQIKRSTATNAQPKLALSRIRRIQLPISLSKQEQAEVVKILDVLANIINIHKYKRDILSKMIKAIQIKVVTYKIDSLNIEECLDTISTRKIIRSNHV